MDGAITRNFDSKATLAQFIADLATDTHGTACAYFARTAYSTASPPNLPAWHLRRIAGTPEHVIRQVYDGLVAEPAALWFREVSGPLLASLDAPVLAFRRDPEAAAWEQSRCCGTRPQRR